jgi:hypothetical protein
MFSFFSNKNLGDVIWHTSSNIFEPFLWQSQHPKQQDPITEPLKNFRSGVPDNIVPKKSC